jgi:hypothetical protein
VGRDILVFSYKNNKRNKCCEPEPVAKLSISYFNIHWPIPNPAFSSPLKVAFEISNKCENNCMQNLATSDMNITVLVLIQIMLPYLAVT